MRTHDLRKQQMFVRVRDFGTARRDTFQAASFAGKLFAAVAAAADALEQQLSSNPRGPGRWREGTTSKVIARQALRRRLTAIATLARALALDTPGIADKFKISLNCGDARLLVVARSFATNSRPLAKLFIAHDMPSNFLTALTGEIDALAEAMVQGRVGLEKAKTMRGDIDATIDKGQRAVAKLNAIVRGRLQDDRTALASWDEARRIDRSARTRSGDSATPAPSSPIVPGGPPRVGEPSATAEASASAPQP
jgi:peptidyl-tRNA hydrolase